MSMASRRSFQTLVSLHSARLSRRAGPRALHPSTFAVRQYITSHNHPHPVISRCHAQHQIRRHSDAASVSKSKVYDYEKVRPQVAPSCRSAWTKTMLHRSNPLAPPHLRTTFSSTCENPPNTKLASSLPLSTFPSLRNRTPSSSRLRTLKTASDSRNHRQRKN